MNRVQLIEETLTRSVIGAFPEACNALGSGFLEHVYVLALEHELLARGHTVGREVSVVVTCKGVELTTQRLDMIVDDQLVVEIKSTNELHKAATRQLFNSLRGTALEVGLLLHFGPEPEFYRAICRYTGTNPSYRSNPTHAYKSSEKPSVPGNCVGDPGLLVWLRVLAVRRGRYAGVIGATEQ